MNDFDAYSKELAEKYGLDIVTVNSYLNSIIEYEGTETERATIFRWLKQNPNQLYSRKFSNIKVDIDFSIKMLIRVSTICTDKILKLIMVLLQLICDLKSQMEVVIDERTSWLVYALFLKGGNGQGVTKENLISYMNSSKPENITDDICEDEFDEIMEKLIKMDSVKLENGKYFLIESVSS